MITATTLPPSVASNGSTALGSLAQSTVTFVIFVVVILMILAELGYNITTIVAGTSVIAVTVTFGLQSIVKDLVSGILMLVEDQLGVGDFVDMEMASGVVEAIGLRVTELREVGTAPSGTCETAKSFELATSARAAPVSQLPMTPRMTDLLEAT